MELLELLRFMNKDIEGIRPKVITKSFYAIYDSLRSFRHFFRHAYTYKLDEMKVKIALEDTQ